MCFYFIIVFYYLLATADVNFIPEKKIPVKANDLEVDNIGNVYLNSGNILIKKSFHSKEVYNYSNNFLGTPHHIDVSNPLQILLYYKTNNVLVFLNNTLTELRSPLKLDDISIYHPLLICSSNFNGFWVFDQSRNTVLFVNKLFEIEVETQNINTIINENIQPNYLQEYNQEVYLNIPGKGILEFNKNGSYFRAIPLYVEEIIQVQNQNIYYLKGDSIGLFNILTKNNYIVALPENGIVIKIQNSKLFILKKDELVVYEIRD